MQTLAVRMRILASWQTIPFADLGNSHIFFIFYFFWIRARARMQAGCQRKQAQLHLYIYIYIHMKHKACTALSARHRMQRGCIDTPCVDATTHTVGSHKPPGCSKDAATYTKILHPGASWHLLVVAGRGRRLACFFFFFAFRCILAPHPGC